MPSIKKERKVIEGRNSKHVYQNKSKKLFSWEDDSDDAYSSMYSGKFSTGGTLERRIYKGIELVSAMRSAIKLDKNVKIITDPRDSSASGSTKIMRLSFEPYLEKTLSYNQQNDIFIGLFLHESCHYKYTDFTLWETYIRGGMVSSICKFLWNVIEDESIEYKLGSFAPGFVAYIGKLKQYVFDFQYKKMMNKNPDYKDIEKAKKHIRLMNMVLNLIRFPENINEEDENDFSDFMDKVENILKPYPNNTLETYKCASLIEKLIIDEVKKDAEEKNSDKKPSDKKGDSEKSDSDGGDSFESDSESDEESESGSMEYYGDDSDGEDGETDEGGDGTSDGDETDSKSSSYELPDENTDEAYEEAVKEAFEKAMEEVRDFATDMNEIFGKENAAKVEANKKVPNLPEIDSEIRKVFNSEEDLKGTDYDAVFVKEPITYSTKNKYDSSRVKVGLGASVIKESLKFLHRDYKLTLNNMRSGYLDVNRLAEGSMGVPTVYKKFGTDRSEKISLVLLMDESGSTSSCDIESPTGRISRAECIRDTAVMITEAVKGIQTVENFFSYGFSTYGSASNEKTEIYIYREPDYNNPIQLGNIKSRLNNRDGEAIINVAKRVRKFTNNKCLFIVLSDGEPYGSGYGGDKAIQHTKRSVKQATKMDFIMLQVAVNRDAAKSKDMYPLCVDFSNSKDIPKAISSFLKTKLRQLTKSTIKYN